MDNRTTNRVKFQPEFTIWENDERIRNWILSELLSHSDGDIAFNENGGKTVNGPEIELSADSSTELFVFPEGIKPSEKFRVRLKPTVHLSSYNLPRFHGEIDHRTIERTIVLDENGEPIETDEEWIESEF